MIKTGSTANNKRKDQNETNFKVITKIKQKEPARLNKQARHPHDRATISRKKRTNGKSANKTKATTKEQECCITMQIYVSWFCDHRACI